MTSAPARSLDVYVVEDNVIVLESLIAALEELAPVHVVGTAADEGVAVDWLAAGGEHCDLVIIDIFLRTGSGLGVIAAARRKRPERGAGRAQQLRHRRDAGALPGQRRRPRVRQVARHRPAGGLLHRAVLARARRAAALIHASAQRFIGPARAAERAC